MMSRALLGLVLACACLIVSPGSNAAAPKTAAGAPVYKNMADLLKKHMHLSSARAILRLTNGTNRYTALADSYSSVFLPNNAAFAKYMLLHNTTLTASAGQTVFSLALSVIPGNLLVNNNDFKIGGNNLSNAYSMPLVVTRTDITKGNTFQSTLTVMGPLGTVANVLSPGLKAGKSRVYMIDTVLEVPILTAPKMVAPPQNVTTTPQIIRVPLANTTTPTLTAPAGGVFPSLAAALSSRPELSFILPALSNTPYAQQLTTAVITLFAPTNAAWDAFANATGYGYRKALLGMDTNKLAILLANHVVNGTGQLISSFADNQVVIPFSQLPLTLRKTNTSFSISSGVGAPANIIFADIAGGQSIIQVIDSVLMLNFPAN